MNCDDLRLGGELTYAGVVGGLSINSTALMVADWSDIFNTPGWFGTVVTVTGRSGGVIVGDKLPKPSYPTLRVIPSRFPDLADCDPGDDPGEWLQERTDDFLTLLADPAGNYLEVDLPGSTRWKRVWAIDPQTVTQASQIRTANVPLVADPYWHDSTGESDTVSGATSVTVGGRMVVWDAVYTFSGNGTIEHLTEDWEMEIAGASGVITVNTGTREILDSMGVDASGFFRRTRRDWAWLLPGNNSLTSTVSVDVDWFPQYA